MFVRQERMEREAAQREQHAGDDDARGRRRRRRSRRSWTFRSEVETSRGGASIARDGAAHDV